MNSKSSRSAAVPAATACLHGGRFFEAVGVEFDTLERLESVISADVLDAWFAPSPKAVAAIGRRLPLLLRTSPPARCEGLVRAISRARGIPARCVLPGAGSSDLIYRAFRHWLTPESRALILDPSYGEYAHIFEHVIHCQVDRVPLSRDDSYRVDARQLEHGLARGYDLVVIVNPNNPTGRQAPRIEMLRALRRVPPATRVWVDETYIDYAGAGQSVEDFASRSKNIVVCKSLSKSLALSGARAAYLCANPAQLEPLRAITPPWAVSLPAQVAVVRALKDARYYAAQYRRTRVLREQLAGWLRKLRWDTIPSVGNFLLCHLPPDGPDAETLIAKCRRHGLYLRNAAPMGSRLGDRAVRIAVKDAQTNRRMVRILSSLKH